MAMLKHVDFEVPEWGELAAGPQGWASYMKTVLDLNPVAYWRLGEAQGDQADDEIAGHHGTYLNGVTLGESGAIFRDADTAVRLDGNNGRIMVPHHATLNIGGANAATWLLWARKTNPNSNSARWLLGKGRPSPGELRYLIELQGNTKRIHLVTNDGNWHDVSSDVVAGFEGWRQIGVTWDGVDTVGFYHDGAAAGSTAFEPGWFPDNSEALTLGAAYASTVQSHTLFHFGGDLDEIALFDTALSAEQMADLYDRAVGIFRVG